ncbi:MAG: hypothetical protein V1495_00565 [Pseudomonadota bacterium]
MSRNPLSAFSFVEVMAAVAILSISLIVLMDNQAKSMDMLGRARTADFATTLAIAKMTELIQTAKAKGVGALRDEDAGEFDQEKYATYKWRSWKTDVPTPDFEALITGMAGGKEEGKKGAAASSGPLQAIEQVWGSALKELHVEVTWGEGRTPRSYELATQLIAPDAVLQIQAALAVMTGGRAGPAPEGTP